MVAIKEEGFPPLFQQPYSCPTGIGKATKRTDQNGWNFAEGYTGKTMPNQYGQCLLLLRKLSHAYIFHYVSFPAGVATGYEWACTKGRPAAGGTSSPMWHATTISCRLFGLQTVLTRQ